jgi:hypothetical protein
MHFNACFLLIKLLELCCRKYISVRRDGTAVAQQELRVCCSVGLQHRRSFISLYVRSVQISKCSQKQVKRASL